MMESRAERSPVRSRSRLFAIACDSASEASIFGYLPLCLPCRGRFHSRGAEMHGALGGRRHQDLRSRDSRAEASGRSIDACRAASNQFTEGIVLWAVIC